MFATLDWPFPFDRRSQVSIVVISNWMGDRLNLLLFNRLRKLFENFFTSYMCVFVISNTITYIVYVYIYNIRNSHLTTMNNSLVPLLYSNYY